MGLVIDADHTNPLPPEPPEGPIPDELVDRFFDRELDDTGRAGFMSRLDDDARACEHVAKTNRFLTLLKRGVRAPDLTDSILDRVDHLRGFVPPKERKLIRFGRIAVAAMLFGVIAGAVIVQRRAPEVVELAGMPTPVRDVARAAAKEADTLFRTASPAQFAQRAPSHEAAAELDMWGPRHLDAQAQAVVSWSLSPAAACRTEEAEVTHALVLIGNRVIVIGDTADFKPQRASLAPITFGARVPLPSVRSSGFRDLP
jgi:hypothetical protein